MTDLDLLKSAISDLPASVLVELHSHIQTLLLTEYPSQENPSHYIGGQHGRLITYTSSNPKEILLRNEKADPPQEEQAAPARNRVFFQKEEGDVEQQASLPAVDIKFAETEDTGVLTDLPCFFTGLAPSKADYSNGRDDSIRNEEANDKANDKAEAKAVVMIKAQIFKSQRHSKTSQLETRKVKLYIWDNEDKNVLGDRTKSRIEWFNTVQDKHAFMKKLNANRHKRNISDRDYKNLKLMAEMVEDNNFDISSRTTERAALGYLNIKGHGGKAKKAGSINHYDQFVAILWKRDEGGKYLPQLIVDLAEQAMEMGTAYDYRKKNTHPDANDFIFYWERDGLDYWKSKKGKTNE